jgi:rare lipoprotein A
LKIVVTASLLALLSTFVFVPSEVQAKSFQRGVASWYGPGFHGRLTANGERFNTNSLTAAHRTLPFGTRVRVTNATTGRSVVVRINDRGPFTRGRVIDLSKAAARAIGVTGVAQVVLARS